MIGVYVNESKCDSMVTLLCHHRVHTGGLDQSVISAGHRVHISHVYSQHPGDGAPWGVLRGGGGGGGALLCRLSI